MRWIGVGYRHELHDWLMDEPSEVSSLEITAEHFFDGREETLAALRNRYPLFVHGLGLSLGTPGPLCADTLSRFARVAELADARWVSEHVSFTRTTEVDLGHLNPIPTTQQSLDILVDHAVEVSERCQRPLILENVTSSLRIEGEMSETQFLNQLCERSGCGLLLDVTNLFINAKNHGFDPVHWMSEIDTSRVKQLHVVGYSMKNGRYQDHHSAPIQPDLMELISHVVTVTSVEAVTLERDDRLQDLPEIRDELNRLRKLSVG